MLKKYYSSEDERELRNLSELMFEEISSGVYHVVKDRHGKYHDYVTSHDVALSMNQKMRKVAIKSEKGIYTNFSLDEARQAQ